MFEDKFQSVSEVGQKAMVLYSGGSFGLRDVGVTTVVAINKRYITDADGNQYLVSTGEMRGTGGRWWHIGPQIYSFDSEIVAEIKEERAEHFFRAQVNRNLDLARKEARCFSVKDLGKINKALKAAFFTKFLYAIHQDD